MPPATIKSVEDLRVYVVNNSMPEPNSGCWLWTGSYIRKYGQLTCVRLFGPIPQYAHRASWVAFKGPIPDGLCVCHKCDTRGCVNPDHLWIGTQTDNLRDMRAKGRHIAGERRRRKYDLPRHFSIRRGSGLYVNIPGHTKSVKTIEEGLAYIASIRK